MRFLEHKVNLTLTLEELQRPKEPYDLVHVSGSPTDKIIRDHIQKRLYLNSQQLTVNEVGELFNF